MLKQPPPGLFFLTLMQIFLVCAAFVAVYVTPLVTAPIASFHFEVGALVVWGLLLIALPRQNPIKPLGQWGGLLLALCLLPAVSIGVQVALGRSTVWQLVLIGLYYHLAMALIALAGWGFVAPEQAPSKRMVAWGLLTALLVAAVLNALAAWFQFLFPGLRVWFVVPLSDVGRAFGNLRQPNQFALFEVWGLLALLAAHAGLWSPSASKPREVSGAISPHSTNRFATLLSGPVGAVLAVLITVAITMSGSRTGAVLVWMMAICLGLLPGLPLRTRWLAVFLAVVHLLAWLLFQTLDRHNLLPFFSVARGLTTTVSLSDSRLALWSDVLVLIRDHPLLGVGYGMLNHALNHGNLFGLPATNNSHNLFLQLAAEHGLPVVVLWTTGLLALLARLLIGWRHLVARFLLVGVLAALFHSQLEYPLWYAHLLLPFVFSLGVLCRLVDAPTSPTSCESMPAVRPDPRTWVQGMSGRLITFLVFVALPLWATADYRKVSPIYEASEMPMLQRIIAGHSSVLFVYLADYASLTAIPVTMESAETHYRLAQRVSRFDFNDLTTFQLMMAAGFTGRWQEAVSLHVRLRSYFPDRLVKREKELTPDAVVIYEKIRGQSSILTNQQPSGS